MNRAWTALLLLVAVIVIGSVGYVLVHDDKVPDAGRTPGYTAAAPPPSGAPTGKTPKAPRSSDSSHSSTVSGSNDPSESGGTQSGGLPEDTRIVFLGDNWTGGEGVDKDTTKAFPHLVGESLKVHASGIGLDGGGYAKPDANGKNYDDFVDKVAALKPTVVVVTGGRNDVSDSAGTLANDANGLFADLKSALPDATLIAVAPFWGDSDHPSELSTVDDAVKSAVEAAGGTYLDLPDPVTGHSEWMADDGNPNEQGEQAVADALGPALQQALS